MNLPKTPSNLTAFCNLSRTRRVEINEIMLAGGAKPFSTDPLLLLSKRQMEVFERIGIGMTTNEIANDMSLSVKTIETHRELIKDALGLRNGNQLIVVAAWWVMNNYSNDETPSEFAEKQPLIK